MPSYPNYPFFPAGSDGIDDDGLPNDWFVPANAGAAASNNPNAPAPAAAPNPAPPAPNPQPSAVPPGPSNQPVPPRPDPFAALWALIPASRVGALAWAPPIFPSSNPFAFQNIPAPPPPFSLNSPRQFPSAGPSPLDDVPPAAANGLFGSTIGRMLAARAKPYDPFEAAANGIWGGIAKMIAANAAPDPSARGFLGSLADLPVPPSAQAASYAPYSGPLLPIDPATFQAGSPPYAFLRNDPPTRADPTGPICDQPPPDQALGAPDTGGESARPNYLLLAGDNEDEEERERQKLDPWASMGLPDEDRPPHRRRCRHFHWCRRFLLARCRQPAHSRPYGRRLPPASSLRPGASPPPSQGPATNSSRASGTPIAPAPAVPRSDPTSEPSQPTRALPGARNVAPAASIGEDGPSAPSIPEWRQFELDKGSQQTIVKTTYQGKDISVVLDFPPDKEGIVDLKKYNWWKPGYMVPFLQGRVAQKFQIQVQKYQTIDPRVKFKFSAEPPPWVVQALGQVGGTYIVDP